VGIYSVESEKVPTSTPNKQYREKLAYIKALGGGSLFTYLVTEQKHNKKKEFDI
jgi:hypothetical protein